jgi:hypothetical protein
MIDRRSFLARMAAWMAALLAAPAVARAAFDETPPVIDSHAEELAAFDRELGLCEDCHDRVARLVMPIAGAPSGGVAYLGDGSDDWGYEARAETPQYAERRICQPCAVIRARAEMVWRAPSDSTIDGFVFRRNVYDEFRGTWA